MYKINTLTILCIFWLVSASAQNEQQILHDLRVDVVYLSSDFIQGRQTGTEYEKLAAAYVARRFEEIGLEPKGEAGTWYQFFDFSMNPHATAEEAGKTGRNVVGYIDNGAATTVVIGAHYDHIGMGGPGSLHAGPAAIHNGADDNASGVAGLLRIAAHLKHQSAARNNNYLFLAFSGEEMGLFGSKASVDNPAVDLSGINYMLNMDMIGRLNDEKSLVVNGAGTSPVWKPRLEAIEVGGLKITTTDSGIGPSDHTSFYLKNIPVLHFFTGIHQQYHKPSDDAYLINFGGLLDITSFMIALIEELDGTGKIAFTKTKDDNPDRKAAEFKVTLGVMPDYTFNGNGMRIDGVLSDRPAERAKLEGGDILIKIGDLEVKDIYDYMEGLSKYKKGDRTIIIIRRGEDTLEKEVVFE